MYETTERYPLPAKKRALTGELADVGASRAPAHTSVEALSLPPGLVSTRGEGSDFPRESTRFGLTRVYSVVSLSIFQSKPSLDLS